MATVLESLRIAETRLAKTSDAPRLDAERLLLHLLRQIETAWLYAHGDVSVTSEQTTALETLVARRATGEPLAYILGEWEFYGRPFLVTPDVLVPRPATEELINAAISYVSSQLSVVSCPLVIADIGTGSGIIAVTLALELKGGVVILATDISAKALAVARKNAVRHGVADQIEFIEGDMLAAIAGRKIDLIVSNPPYIPSAELDSPAPRGVQGKIETRGLDFEPKLALDGGPDGQKFVDQIKNAGIPAVVETTTGGITSFNLTETSSLFPK